MGHRLRRYPMMNILDTRPQHTGHGLPTRILLFFFVLFVCFVVNIFYQSTW